MQLNVLNDLAEAMKALDGKKNVQDNASTLLIPTPERAMKAGFAARGRQQSREQLRTGQFPLAAVEQINKANPKPKLFAQTAGPKLGR